MPIHIERDGDAYTAYTVPSAYKDVAWRSNGHIGRRALIDQLIELGYHLQDVSDALHMADLEWERSREQNI
jgi:hypothetical protein